MKSLCNYNMKIKRKIKFIDYIQEITSHFYVIFFKESGL